MANACRDNFERAQFVGYDPRMVRFFQFALSGFFAGIAGALYALTYEIVTFDTVAGAMSANALLMTYIGGVGTFAGPVVGAILIVLLQSWVSLLSNSWLVYVGRAVHPDGDLRPRRHRRARDDAPADLARGPPGPPRRALRAAASCPALLVVVGFVLLDRAVLLPHHRRLPGQDASRSPGSPSIPQQPAAVGGRRAAAGGGGLWLRREARRFARPGTRSMEEIKAARDARMSAPRDPAPTDVHKSFGPTAGHHGREPRRRPRARATRSSARTARARPRCST